MKLEDVKIGMKVVPHSKSGVMPEVDFESYLKTSYFKEFFNKNGYVYVTNVEDKKNIVLGGSDDLVSKDGDYFLASDIEPYIEQPKPVDLSTIKVGEKYVIGEINTQLNEGFSYEGKGVTNGFKEGGIIEIREDCDGNLCMYKDGAYSYEIRDNRFTLYPLGLIKPMEVFQDTTDFTEEDLDEMEHITQESQKVLSEDEYTPSEPTSSDIEYARKYYNGYLKVAKAYMNQFDHYSALVCSNEDEREKVLGDTLGWVTDSVQMRICNILGIEFDGVVIDILHDSSKDMEEFDVIIGRLKMEGVIK